MAHFCARSHAENEDAGKVAPSRTAEAQGTSIRVPREPKPPAGVFGAAGLRGNKQEQWQGKAGHAGKQQQGKGSTALMCRPRERQDYYFPRKGPMTKQSKRRDPLAGRQQAREGGRGGRGGVVEKDWVRKGGVQMDFAEAATAAAPSVPGLGAELNAGVNLHILNKVSLPLGQ